MHKKLKGAEWAFFDHAIHHGVYKKGVFTNANWTDKRFANLFVCLEHNITFSSPLILALFFINPTFAWTLLAFSIFHFFLYNYVHSGLHLGHKLFLIEEYEDLVRWNHFSHHQHPDKFFCVTLPGVDWLLGTTCKMDKKDIRSWLKLKNQILIERKADEELMLKYNDCEIPKFKKLMYKHTTDGELPDPPTPRDKELGAKFCKLMSKIQLGKITINGELPEYPCILASNHISWLDIFIFVALIKKPFRIMAAESVLKFSPILGYFLPKYMGCYPAATGKAIDSSIELLKSGQSIVICPEGWAYHDGIMRKFKTGAVRIAQKAFAPIVPVCITYKKLPPPWIMKLPFFLQCLISGLFLMFKGDVIINIGKPINASMWQYKDIKYLTGLLEDHVRILKV